VIVSLACLSWHSATAQVGDGGPDKSGPKPNTIDVEKLYTLTGSMGDGSNGNQYVKIDEVCKTNVRPNRQSCIKITYTVGPLDWAGVYWQNKSDNWGDEAGEDFSGKSFKKISFWAKGEKGGEVVEFKGGGIRNPNKTYKDSFEATTGKITLERNWKQYDISLEDKNLHTVIGLFCWVASGRSNPAALTFYLDDIQYEQ